MPLKQKLGRALSILQNSRIYVHVLKIKLFTQIYKLISFFNEKSYIEREANAKQKYLHKPPQTVNYIYKMRELL